MKTLIQGGAIYSRGEASPGDLLIEDGAIAAVGDCRERSGGAEIIDATGCHILPGLIDLHVHLDDTIGGFNLADTWDSASRAAIAAGITTLGGFITQKPDESLSAAIESAESRAAGRSFCDYLWHLTPTRFTADDWIEILDRLDAGWRTFKFYTTYCERGLFSSYTRLTEIAERLAPRGGRLLVHAEDEGALTRAQSADTLPSRASDHAWMRPAEAELRAVQQISKIAAATGAWFHIVHVSTPEAAEAIAEAAGRARLTSETAPHYLFLDDSWLSILNGHRWLCTPPLRDAARAAHLRDLARAGAFFTFATDHCPFTIEDKDSGDGDVLFTPMGVAGIGALPSLAFALEADRPERAFAEMSLRLAENPARLAGLEDRKGALARGFDADVAVFEISDLEAPITSASAGSAETYPGFHSPLRLRHLFLRGRRLIADGAWTGPETASGRCLWTS